MSAVPTLDDYAVAAFEQDAKIGLLATVDGEGRPHLSLITSLQAKSPTRLMFGQFCEGLSKQHVLANPRTAFVVMNENKELWRGQARWAEKKKSGEDYEAYNHKPMFRYNSYFGIHTVHYLDLTSFAGKERLSMGGIALGTVELALLARLARSRDSERALKPWAQKLIAEKTSLKFIAWVGADGFPVIAPVVPATAPDGARVIFTPSVYRRELAQIPAGAAAAIFALNLQMESVLVRGRFSGYRRFAGIKAGTIDIDWVYNSMPPKHGQIYPQPPQAAVQSF